MHVLLIGFPHFYLQPTGTVPPSPEGPVFLTRTEGDEEFPTLSDAGQYYMNFTSPLPDPQQSYTHPTAIIVFVRQSNGGKVTYIWMVSITLKSTEYVPVSHYLFRLVLKKY